MNDVLRAENKRLHGALDTLRKMTKIRIGTLDARELERRLINAHAVADAEVGSPSESEGKP